MQGFFFFWYKYTKQYWVCHHTHIDGTIISRVYNVRPFQSCREGCIDLWHIVSCAELPLFVLLPQEGQHKWFVAEVHVAAVVAWLSMATKKKEEKRNIQKGQSQALYTSTDRFHRSLKLNRCLIKVDSNHDLVTEVLLDFVLWCFDQPWWSQSCNQDRWRSQRCLHESDSADEWGKERRRCGD